MLALDCVMWCRFEANFGAQVVTIAFHALGAGEGGGARLLRHHERMDVLL